MRRGGRETRKRKVQIECMDGKEDDNRDRKRIGLH
jgi:hypothetical protein